MEEKPQHKPNNKGNRQGIKANKTSYLKFRVTPLDKSIIRHYAQERQLSTGEYLRRTALNLKLPKTYTGEEMKYMNLLVNHITSLRRLSNLIKDKQPLLEEIQQMINMFKEELKRIKG